jgi:hypothetical protein
MRLIYALLLALFVLALGVLEFESSREAARMANYPDSAEVSASPAMID